MSPRLKPAAGAAADTPAAPASSSRLPRILRGGLRKAISLNDLPSYHKQHHRGGRGGAGPNEDFASMFRRLGPRGRKKHIFDRTPWKTFGLLPHMAPEVKVRVTTTAAAAAAEAETAETAETPSPRTLNWDVGTDKEEEAEKQEGVCREGSRRDDDGKGAGSRGGGRGAVNKRSPSCPHEMHKLGQRKGNQQRQQLLQQQQQQQQRRRQNNNSSPPPPSSGATRPVSPSPRMQKIAMRSSSSSSKVESPGVVV